MTLSDTQTAEATLLSRLFEEEQKYLNYFFSKLDLKMAEEVLHAFLGCRGVLFFTGVGKSGFIAKKVAATFVSIGVKAFYLSPLDTLHGDLGGVTQQDLVVLFSKSGESDELIQMVPYLRNKGAQLISVVVNPKSRLARGSDLVVTLPLQRELCPFDLAPTTSTTVQLIFGNVLAVAYMNAKGMSLEEFAINHPGGRIGRTVALKVRDLMVCGEQLPLCRGEDLLGDVLVDFSNKRCGCICIVDASQKLCGIFTDGDLRRALQKNQSEVLRQPMKALMTAQPRSVKAEILAWKAVEAMEADPKRPITCMPVVGEDHRLLGLIRMHDILQTGL